MNVNPHLGLFIYIKSTGFQLHFLAHVTGVNYVIYTLLKVSKGYVGIWANVHVCVIKVKLNVSHYF